MLIITRTKGSRLVIDNDITVTVLEISGNQVKLGIDAPQEVDIMRGELYDQGVRTTFKRLEEQR